MTSADNSVRQLLLQQRDNITTLLGLLSDEKDALGLNNPEALEKVVDAKNQLLESIQQFDSQLSQNASVIEEVSQNLHTELMSEINTLLAQAKKQNDINGSIIKQSQITVNRIRTTILEGQGKSSLTYDEKAKTSTGVNTLNVKA